VLVVHGCKQIQGEGVELTLHASDMMLVTRRCQGDVVNTPDTLLGRYTALVIPLDEQILAAARLLWAAPVINAAHQGAPAVRLQLKDWEPVLQRWAHAQLGDDAPSARLALTDMVLKLCALGHVQLLIPEKMTLVSQIQALVQAEPARCWTSADVESALGLSGATLRRRMALEGTCLRDQIRQARLARALEWLYTTQWPIKTLAARVGYQSSASFVRQFRARYGLAPSAIGNAPVNAVSSDLTLSV
jgi:AraC-like DNA-binding protein